MTPQEALDQAGCITDLSPGQQQAIQTLGALALISSGGGGGGSNRQLLFNYQNLDFGNYQYVESSDPISLKDACSIPESVFTDIQNSLDTGKSVKICYQMFFGSIYPVVDQYTLVVIYPDTSNWWNSITLGTTTGPSVMFTFGLSMEVRKLEEGSYEYFNIQTNIDPYQQGGPSAYVAQSYVQTVPGDAFGDDILAALYSYSYTNTYLIPISLTIEG